MYHLWTINAVAGGKMRGFRRASQVYVHFIKKSWQKIVNIWLLTLKMSPETCEMRDKLQEIADVLKIPRGTVTWVISRYKLRGDVEIDLKLDVPVYCQWGIHGLLLGSLGPTERHHWKKLAQSLMKQALRYV